MKVLVLMILSLGGTCKDKGGSSDSTWAEESTSCQGALAKKDEAHVVYRDMSAKMDEADAVYRDVSAKMDGLMLFIELLRIRWMKLILLI